MIVQYLLVRVKVHGRKAPLSSSLLLQQFTSRLVRLIWEVGSRTATVLYIAFKICLIEFVAFLCKCRQAFFLYALSVSMWHYPIVVLIRQPLGKIIYRIRSVWLFYDRILIHNCSWHFLAAYLYHLKLNLFKNYCH